MGAGALPHGATFTEHKHPCLSDAAMHDAHACGTARRPWLLRRAFTVAQFEIRIRSSTGRHKHRQHILVCLIRAGSLGRQAAVVVLEAGLTLLHLQKNQIWMEVLKESSQGLTDGRGRVSCLQATAGGRSPQWRRTRASRCCTCTATTACSTRRWRSGGASSTFCAATWSLRDL